MVVDCRTQPAARMIIKIQLLLNCVLYVHKAIAVNVALVQYALQH